MLVIGLTGSIAMGKSEAARILAAYGLPVFDSDTEVHRLYDSEQGAKLVASLVPEATRDSKVNREIITKAVLADQTLLSKLEKVVHAEIRARRQAFIAAASSKGMKA
ncbi:MAG: dephospho-CoA kinase, partial [Aestuariivirga sp.]